mgnify:CR=1 FL=1
MNIFMFGVSSGSAIFISQYWGNREMDGISRTYGMVTLSAVGVALGFMVVALTAPRWVLGLFTNEAPVIEEGVQYLEIAFPILGSALIRPSAPCCGLRRT